MNSGYLTIMLTVWTIACNCHISSAMSSSMCLSSEYFNKSSNECTTCTNCEDTGLQYYANCTSTSDSICYSTCPDGQFFNRSSALCTNCSHCTRTQTECTPINDAVCNICTDQSKIYNAALNVCVTDCPSSSSPCVCSAGEYYNNITKSCAPCGNCLDNQFILAKCSPNHDTVCQESCPVGQFFDIKTQSCKTCTDCKSPKDDSCSGANDTFCCLDREFYHPLLEKCTPRCTECPNGCDTNFNCKCTECYTGRFCETLKPECSTTTPPIVTDPPVTRSTEEPSTTVNPITSALIALGAVVGIILFSALFVLLGVISSCNRGQQTPQNYSSSSNNSTDKFLEDTKAASALISMYKQNSLPLGATSIDLMKLTGSGRSLNSSSSSGSPRSSPKFPGGTPRSSPAKHKDNVHYSFRSPAIAVPV